MNNEDRWKQRFQNMEKSFNVLQQRIDDYDAHDAQEVYQLALVRAFEINMDMSQKTLKDYLENEGIKSTTPKEIIRHAFQAELVRDGEVWMEALENRNLTDEIYDEGVLRRVVDFIRKRYYTASRDLYHDLKAAQ